MMYDNNYNPYYSNYFRNNYNLYYPYQNNNTYNNYKYQTRANINTIAQTVPEYNSNVINEKIQDNIVDNSTGNILNSLPKNEPAIPCNEENINNENKRINSESSTNSNNRTNSKFSNENQTQNEDNQKDINTKDRELCFGPVKICDNKISLFGFSLDIDTIIILGLIVFFIFENNFDISILIILGLLFLT